jgi:hypothetical protein
MRRPPLPLSTHIWISLVALAFAPVTAQAATLAKRNAANFLRIATLEKLTVGPSDNFQGVVSPDGKLLFFTQNRNMASTVQMASLASIAERGRDKPLAETNFDTRDPAPSPDGLRVAFTSFQKNARGAICIATLQTGESKCLPTGRRGASLPQWINNNSVAYLEKTDDVEIQNLMKIDLSTQKKESLFSENVLAFTLHPDKNTVVYVTSDGVGEKPTLKWKPLAQNQPASTLAFELPGLSGFPRFDKEGRFLYFIQFFNDTNNDGEIDGNDNSVPFRIPWPVASQTGSVPEQLISAEYNCGYPAPTHRNLVVTCNFEDSLDIYRMPLSGTIPSNWTETQLLSAHAAARTVPERILILNTLRFRFPARFNSTETLERLLANHVVAGEFDASIYYTGLLSGRRADLKPLLETLTLYFESARSAQRETSPLPSPAFADWIRAASLKLSQAPANQLTPVVQAYLLSLLGRNTEAWNIWSSIPYKTFTSPLAFHVYGSVGARLAALSPQPVDNRLLLEWRLADSPLFEDEGRSSHALAYVRLLEQQNPDDAARQTILSKKLAETPPDTVLSQFIQADLAAIDLLAAKTQKDEGPAISRLSKVLNVAKPRYFLKRAINVRLFTLFSQRNRESAVNMIASRWVSETKKADAEFVHAREQYLLSRLDKAYTYLSESKNSFAGDIFYEAVRVTDDAEAHLGFVKTRLGENRGKELDEQYAKLEKGGFIAENGALASTWRNLVSAPHSDEAIIAGSITALENILAADGYNPAVAWFLLGVANHKSLLASRNGLEFNRDPANAAHHAYLVAADLARSNRRMLAPIYANLGQLHMVTRSYGLSARFYSQRLKLPFASRDDHILTLWRAGRALFAGNDAPAALGRLEEALTLLPSSSLSRHKPAFLEHAAFYALDAGQWEKSLALYQELEKSIPNDLPRNAIKRQMSKAWVLSKLQRRTDAYAAAEKLLEMAKALPKTTDTAKEELVPFQPERYAAMAYALLATNSNTPEQSISWREKRIKLLLTWEERLDQFSLNKPDWRGFLLREANRRATLLTETGKTGEALTAWSEALSNLTRLYIIKDDASDPALFTTLQNTLVAALGTSKKVSTELRAQLESTVPELLAQLKATARGNPTNTVRWYRLSLAWNAFERQSGKLSSSSEEERRTKLLESEPLRALRDDDPDLLAGLPGRAKFIENPQ